MKALKTGDLIDVLVRGDWWGGKIHEVNQYGVWSQLEIGDKEFSDGCPDFFTHITESETKIVDYETFERKTKPRIITCKTVQWFYAWRREAHGEYC